MGFCLNSVTFSVHVEIHLNNAPYFLCAFSSTVSMERKQGRLVGWLQSEKYAFE